MLLKLYEQNEGLAVPFALNEINSNCGAEERKAYHPTFYFCKWCVLHRHDFLSPFEGILLESSTWHPGWDILQNWEYINKIGSWDERFEGRFDSGFSQKDVRI